ncbi:MAG: ATP-dependent DNA helicase RecG [Verrucomicrobiales bacterium]|nr:ATP-dependent DNA helicase RecG [Verrucomicrobiales bacterium]MED5586898.1 ATP-dependent DNA helicase RecG [Verrucomicrobiota bacterium]
MPTLRPETPIAELEALDTKLCTRLQKAGCRCLADLLTYYPRRYENRGQFHAFPPAETGSAVCLRGYVVDSAKRFFGRRRFFEAVVEDEETGGMNRITLRWFNMAFIHKLVAVGQQIIFYGKVKQSGKRLVMDHPEFETFDSGAEESGIHLGRITPVYPLKEGIGQRPLRRALFEITSSLHAEDFPEILPGNKKPLDKTSFLPRGQALQAIHFPGSEAQLLAARHTLALEEFFILQLKVARRRAGHLSLPGAPHCGNGKLLEKFLASLPFRVTGAQERCVAEIRADLEAKHPMNRLLQGDVGSGKTLVAVSAILLAVESGCQAALMAPTQILAEQHYLVLNRWLSPLGIRVGLRTATRRENEEMPLFDDSQPQVLVGTHALFYGTGEFDDLGLVVIDEQHKFGVTQRGRLIGQGTCPDVLVMTATPIPRTLTLTVYGDLDVSVLDEAPGGRGEIITAVRAAGKDVQKATRFLKDHLGKGRQAYLVYPLVEDSDKLKAQSVEGEYQKWVKRLAPFKCSLLHGRVPAEEKESIMHDFREARTHVLVTTTVIEVGVDVANANMMYIYNAERFGLAQLHQLRGRIGRGSHKSYCILMADKPSADASEKLRVLEKSSDGFEIAEADLRLRGPGELLGTAQSGISGLKLGDLVTEPGLVQKARDLARHVINEDAALEKPEHQHLKLLVSDDEDGRGVLA